MTAPSRHSSVLAIVGSYRKDGVVDQAVEAAACAAAKAGAIVEIVHLRDQPIGFCRNCRECTQAPGQAPGQCVQHDGMNDLIERIEAADCFILASPTNFFTVTAVFKRFMERLVVYAYWPWGMRGPQYRKKQTKSAIVIASAAAPAWIGRIFYTTSKQLRVTAKTIGARTVGDIFVDLAAGDPAARLTESQVRRIERSAARLIAG